MAGIGWVRFDQSHPQAGCDVWIAMGFLENPSEFARVWNNQSTFFFWSHLPSLTDCRFPLGIAMGFLKNPSRFEMRARIRNVTGFQPHPPKSEKIHSSPRIPSRNISCSFSMYSTETRLEIFGAIHSQRQMLSMRPSWVSIGSCCCFWHMVLAEESDPTCVYESIQVIFLAI